MCIETLRLLCRVDDIDCTALDQPGVHPLGWVIRLVDRQAPINGKESLEVLEEDRNLDELLDFIDNSKTAGTSPKNPKGKKKKGKDKNCELRVPSTPSASDGYAKSDGRLVEVIPFEPSDGPDGRPSVVTEERSWPTQAVLDPQQPDQRCSPVLATTDGQGVADVVTDDDLIGELMTRYRRLQEQSQRTETEAKLSVIRELLEVFDELEQADAEIGEDSKATRLIFSVTRKFEAKLQGLGLQRIDALGRSFDARLHRASGEVPPEGFGSKVVVEELESGWVLGADVVRQSLVAMG